MLIILFIFVSIIFVISYLNISFYILSKVLYIFFILFSNNSNINYINIIAKENIFVLVISKSLILFYYINNDNSGDI